MRVYTMHDADRHQDHLAFIKLQWLPAELFHKFSATKPKHLAFIYASGF